MQKVDAIIHARWIINCEENLQTFENHALIISAGKIEAILPSDQAEQKYDSDTIQRLQNHAILPGFINCHTHLPMNLFRGLADDLPLMDWLKSHIWPAEKKWVNADFVEQGARLAIAEMIRSGTTCCNDMYFFSEEIAKAADQAGIRAHLGITIIDVPTAYAESAEGYFERGLAFYEAYKNHPRIKLTFAPHSTYMVSPEHLLKIKALAHQYQLKINIHLQEDPAEITLSMKKYGARPLERLNQMEMVSPDLIGIHLTQVNEADLRILQDKKPNIVHCPESNMKLASGICPVQSLLDLNINVALGTDGAASNNDLDMISEMRSAALLGKLGSEDPTAVKAETVLKMATLHGAKALGIDHLTGSLTPGKSADFITIALDEIETQPIYHPISQIVYATSRHQIKDTWVCGKPLMRDRQLQTIDEAALLANAKEWQKRIQSLS